MDVSVSNHQTPKKPGAFRLGLWTLMPMLLTAALLIVVGKFIYYRIALPVGDGVLAVAEKIGGESLANFMHDMLKVSFDRLAGNEFYVALVGFPVAVILIMTVGLLASVLLRGRILKMLGALISAIPLVRSIYPYIREFIEFLLGADETKRIYDVVAAQYPGTNMYSVGYVTNEGLKAVDEMGKTGHRIIFTSATPIPATGFAYFIPRDELIKLNASTEEIFLMTLTGGILTPLGERQAANPRTFEVA
jgi:uncharacterized membrane protein